MLIMFTFLVELHVQVSYFINALSLLLVFMASPPQLLKVHAKYPSVSSEATFEHPSVHYE